LLRLRHEVLPGQQPIYGPPEFLADGEQHGGAGFLFPSLQPGEMTLGNSNSLGEFDLFHVETPQLSNSATNLFQIDLMRFGTFLSCLFNLYRDIISLSVYGEMTDKPNLSRDIRIAKSLYRDLPKSAFVGLRELMQRTGLSILAGEVLSINGAWYVSHSGLVRLAERQHCFGIHTHQVQESCDPANSRWVFRATVFKSPRCKGFTGYGDADPSNISPLVHGAELRVAETRAVNRALRKAYGIGICSVEEIGSMTPRTTTRVEAERNVRKLSPESANGNRNGHGSNGNANGIRVRDRLCQLIRSYRLDADLVKAYAIDFCGTQSLREANREQVENFVVHLADWAAKDRNALLCQLNSYSRPQAGTA
jgi:hypothetical protein